jgi:hypothetical protein
MIAFAGDSATNTYIGERDRYITSVSYEYEGTATTAKHHLVIRHIHLVATNNPVAIISPPPPKPKQHHDPVMLLGSSRSVNDKPYNRKLLFAHYKGARKCG